MKVWGGQTLHLTPSLSLLNSTPILKFTISILPYNLLIDAYVRAFEQGFRNEVY